MGGEGEGRVGVGGQRAARCRAHLCSFSSICFLAICVSSAARSSMLSVYPGAKSPPKCSSSILTGGARKIGGLVERLGVVQRSAGALCSGAEPLKNGRQSLGKF